VLPHRIFRRAHWGKVSQFDRGSSATLPLGPTPSVALSIGGNREVAGESRQIRLRKALPKVRAGRATEPH